MPVPPSGPYQIVLTVDERAALVALTRPTAQARMGLRARIVLAAADGATNTAIAVDQRVRACSSWRCQIWRSVFLRLCVGVVAGVHGEAV